MYKIDKAVLRVFSCVIRWKTKENSLGELEGDISLALLLLQTKLLAACKFLAQGQLQSPIKICQLLVLGLGYGLLN